MELGEKQRVPASKCPHCEKILDGASSTNGENIKPKSGDAMICIYCGNINIYGDDGELRKSTKIELDKLLSDPEIYLAQSKIKRFIEWYKTLN